jgi:hypothetical protein
MTLRCRTSLQNAPSEPMTPQEMEARCADAWLTRGVIVVLRPEEIDNEWVRAGLVQWASRRYGKRMKRR